MVGIPKTNTMYCCHIVDVLKCMIVIHSAQDFIFRVGFGYRVKGAKIVTIIVPQI